MLQDELSKYSLNMMKINVKNVSKPKIYNIKSSVNTGLIGGLSNADGVLSFNGGIGGVGGLTTGQSGVVIETVRVPFPVLVDRFNIIAKSENALFNNSTFYGFGKMQVLLYPFDNIIRFSIATGTDNIPEYLNMVGITEIKFVIKNDKDEFSFPLFIESGDINLAIGQVIFKIPQNKFNSIKKVYETGINLFYIVGTTQATTSVIYTGLFKIYDNKLNVETLNEQAPKGNPSIILDPNQVSKETAIDTRKLINEQVPVIKPGSVT